MLRFHVLIISNLRGSWEDLQVQVIQYKKKHISPLNVVHQKICLIQTSKS